MNARLHALVLVGAAALAAPRLALAMGTIEGFYGIARPPGTSFRSDVNGAVNDPHLFKNSKQMVGGDVLLGSGFLELGAIADHSWASGKGSQTALGGLLGLKVPLGALRLDLLGEAGGHRYGDLGKETNDGKDVWRAYVGLRPGLALKLGQPSLPGLVVGLWTFVRWDLNSDRVPVTNRNVGSTTPASLKLGGSTIGATLRLGFDF
jgi:hypothetical protein